MRLFLLLGCFLLLSSACTAVFPQTAPYSAKAEKDDTVISFDASGSTLFIDITSVSGIGAAEIKRHADAWPQAVVLRLHLKGLEQFEFMYVDTAVTLAISSQSDQHMQQSVRQINQAAQPINPTSDFWMETTIVTDDGSPATIPLSNGSFNIHAPQEFLDKNAETFEISWIDFFR